MNYTKSSYIKLISACINDTDVQIDYDNIDIKQLVRLCSIHRNAGIVFMGMKKTQNVPAEFFKTLENGFFAEMLHYSKRMSVWNIIKEELDRAKINHIVIKGQSIAKLYPVPEVRTMGDVDLLVAQKDFEAVHDIMMALNADYKSVGSDEITNAYSLGNINIEVNSAIGTDSYFSGSVNFREYFKDAFNNADLCDGYTYELKPQYNLIYVLYHMAKHFYKNGCGVRMVTDVSVIMKAYEQIIDMNTLYDELKKIGLEKFANRIFAICNNWFENEIACEESDFKEINLIAENIISGGVFGYENVDGDTGRIRKNNSKNYFVSVIKWAFPTYKQMRRHSIWFKDKPAILLPVAYVERFIRNAKERGGMVRWIKNIVSGKKKNDSHNDILKIMGLE